MWRKALFTILLLLAVPAVALAQYNSVTLAWDPNTESDLSGYVVYWGTSSGTYGSSQDVGNVTQYTVNGLEELRTYYFVVRAYNTQGLYSAPSGEVSKLIPADPERVRGAVSRLIWRHETTGAVAQWYMDGNKQMSGAYLGPGMVSDLNWQVVASGDFNGDGDCDVIWQHTDGRLSAWLMRGDILIDGRLLVPNQVTDTNWRIVGAGDFDADQKPDLVWQHRTQGRIAVWLMNGTVLKSGLELVPGVVADLNWKIFGVADMNQDGNADLLWRHETSGALAAWLMRGASLVDGRSLTPGAVTDLNWRPVTITDFNGDGSPDLVWQHEDGRIGTWIMSGTTMVSGPPLQPGNVPDAGWRIVGRR